MATQLQLRRGNTTQTNAFTGAIAEVTVDTDKKTLVIHDGSTAGGIPLAKESALSSNATSIISAYAHANLSKAEIVVIGGGYGGATAAKYLRL